MIARREGTTEKLYEADGYLSCFEALVLSCQATENGFAVVLDRTAFFPEGGGQYADRGTLDGVRVTDVQIREGALLHYTDAPLTPGATVTGRIDGALRRRRMQNHSGEHVISGLIHAAYGYDNVGFHLADGEMTMDINGTLSAEQLSDIERRANEVVWRNVPIRAEYPTSEVLKTLQYRSKLALTEDVRIVTVEGVDMCACCAPHVRSTGEIGIIRIMDSMNYKGGMRLFVLCGEDAFDAIRREHEALTAIARSFSTGRDEALRSVLRMQEENGTLRAALGQSRRALGKCRLEIAAASGERHILLFDVDSDAAAMRAAAEEGKSLCEGVCGVFAPAENGTLRYVCTSKSIALRALSKQLNDTFAGRGGGSDQMIQGSIFAEETALRAFFSNF